MAGFEKRYHGVVSAFMFATETQQTIGEASATEVLALHMLYVRASSRTYSVYHRAHIPFYCLVKASQRIIGLTALAQLMERTACKQAKLTNPREGSPEALNLGADSSEGPLTSTRVC